MALNFPPPPPLQFLQPDNKTIGWNWHYWFQQIQTIAGKLDKVNVPTTFSTSYNYQTNSVTVTWNNVTPGTVLAGPFPEYGNGIPLGIPAMFGGSASGQPSFITPDTNIFPAPQWAQTKITVGSGEVLNILAGFQTEIHNIFTLIDGGKVINSGQLIIEGASNAVGFNFTGPANIYNILFM